jgi:putative hydrolase of the HAD superfamily
MTIEAVIFDFGGVILDVDYEATSIAMHHILGPQAHIMYSKAQQSPIFDQFEVGQLSRETFYYRLALESGRTLDPADVDRAWNAMLGNTRLERIQFVQRVARYRRIFLLSNTNIIHKEAFDKTLQNVLKGQSFEGLFEKAYYSHEMGLRKPRPEIFRYLIQKHDLNPEKTLFIDDSEANIRGAEKAGLKVFHLHGELLDAPLAYLEEPVH